LPICKHCPSLPALTGNIFGRHALKHYARTLVPHTDNGRRPFGSRSRASTTRPTLTSSLKATFRYVSRT
jgi:hypothetical protein